MAEPDLLIEAGFSDAKLAQEVQKVVAKYKQAGDAAEKAFKDASGGVADSQALKAHMRELDKVQRAYDPVYRATQKYTAELTKLDRALQIGGIDQAKYTAEVRKAQVELGQVSGAIEQQVKPKLQGGADGFRNLGFQVQDFAVQVGAGTSATQAFAQQFPQLASGFGPVGIALGTAAAILVPLAGALFGAGEEAQTLEEQLEALEKTTGAMTAAAQAAATPIEELREKYGDLADEVDRANKSMAQITATTARRDAQAAARRLGGELGDLPNLNAFVGPDGSVRAGYEKAYAQGLAQAVASLNKQLGAGEAEAKALMAAINQLGRGTGPDDLLAEVTTLQEALAAITPTTNQQQRALQDMADQVRPIAEAAAAQVEAGADREAAARDKVIAKYAETTTKLKELAAERAILVEATKSADKALAESAREGVRNIDRQIAKVKELAREMDDMMDRGSFFSGPYQAPPDARGSAFSTARDMIGKFEGGYVPQPYWDVNKYRAGYGSETYTTADGIVKAVVAGVKVSKEDADRDLDRRVLAYFEEQRRVVGPAWISFTDAQKAALASIQHNYGSIPNRIKPALATGDAQAIATAIAGLAMDYTKTEPRDGSPINYNRRMQEAAAFGDTSVQAARNTDENKRLQDEIRERERKLELVKQYGENLSKNLLTEQQTAQLETERAQKLAEINASSMSDEDKAAAIAAVNAEMQRQVTILGLVAEAQRRGVELDAQMIGSTMTYRQAIEALGDAQYARAVAEQQAAASADKLRQSQEFAAQQTQALKDGLVDAIIEGNNFADVLANVAQALAKAALQAALFGEGPFSGGGGGGLLGSLFSGGIGALFSGARANGGPVSAGQMYWTGERGPEPFVPAVNGRILSVAEAQAAMRGGAGSGPKVIINNNAPGVQVQTDAVSRDEVRLMITQANRAMPSRVAAINRDPLRR